MDSRKLTDRLRAQCSRREYCSCDILGKALKALDGDHKAAREVLETLKAEKYVDDKRYAEAFARDKSAIAGWGAVKIRYMLSAKGISKEYIDVALGETDSEKAEEKLYKLLTVKAKTLKGDPNIRLKLLRFALGRGYGYDEVNSILERLAKDSKQ